MWSRCRHGGRAGDVRGVAEAIGGASEELQDGSDGRVTRGACTKSPPTWRASHVHADRQHACTTEEEPARLSFVTCVRGIACDGFARGRVVSSTCATPCDVFQAHEGPWKLAKSADQTTTTAVGEHRSHLGSTAAQLVERGRNTSLRQSRASPWNRPASGEGVIAKGQQPLDARRGGLFLHSVAMR